MHHTSANSLDRFLDAQETVYETALAEITRGRKTSHWMWYIFPQIAGLGSSDASRYYAIRDITEAQAYLDHLVLGKRLIDISSQLLLHKGKSAFQIFGSPDDMKLHSSMTLFAAVTRSHPVFQQVLDQFFAGKKNAASIRKLAGDR